jgi:hypothetical protein
MGTLSCRWQSIGPYGAVDVNLRLMVVCEEWVVVIGKSDGLTNHISSVKIVAIPRVVTCRHSTISSL